MNNKLAEAGSRGSFSERHTGGPEGKVSKEAAVRAASILAAGYDCDGKDVKLILSWQDAFSFSPELERITADYNCSRVKNSGFYSQFSIHHPCDMAGSDLRPLSKIPHCCR